MENSQIEKDASQNLSDDLPRIKNYPLYFWRVFRKFFILVFFGIGTLIVVIAIFPIMRLVIRNNAKFRKKGHHFISCVLEFYIHLMSWLKICEFKISKEDLQTLRNLKGNVIIANHPSLLDVIYILAFVRDTDCIVKASLQKSWVGGVVKALYISNNVDFKIMEDECVEALKAGGNLIIFPEGTRSPVNGMNQFKKGAARIALAANAAVQPIFIGGNRKYGMGKGEPVWKVNPVERYKYEFTVLEKINVEKYSTLGETLAAKHLTEDMRTSLEAYFKKS
ncbi:MAG: 1-acyl-sn-glycerol-3-phosphate acyltransferase [Treponemataceae bacterium]|nr:1-acyl-sn-glycerol-3-phosphate acyltransferase [Treponemataceae bacterium]